MASGDSFDFPLMAQARRSKVEEAHSKLQFPHFIHGEYMSQHIAPKPGFWMAVIQSLSTKVTRVLK